MGCQTSKPEDVQPPPTPPTDADTAKSPPTPQAAPADVLDDVFEDSAPVPAPTPSGFARALGVAQDPASPPSTRGRSLSPSSSRGDLVEDGKTASPPSTPSRAATVSPCRFAAAIQDWRPCLEDVTAPSALRAARRRMRTSEAAGRRATPIAPPAPRPPGPARGGPAGAPPRLVGHIRTLATYVHSLPSFVKIDSSLGVEAQLVVTGMTVAATEWAAPRSARAFAAAASCFFASFSSARRRRAIAG